MADPGALILASARGAGFGGAVALGKWQTGTVLDHLISVVRTSGIEDVAVVVGPMSDSVIEATSHRDVTFVVDDDWAEGLASGLRAGLDTLWRETAAGAVVVFEVDRPGIDAGVVSSLLAGHGADRPVTAPKYRYSLGLPLVIDRGLWPRLMGLEGPVDLIDLITAHHDWVKEVWFDRVPPSRVVSPDDVAAQVHRR